MSCDELYKSVVSGAEGDGYILFELAQCFLSGYDPEKLRSMLRSEDDGVVSDGLFVLSETGDLAKAYTKDILALEHSQDAEVRRKATALSAVYRA